MWVAGRSGPWYRVVRDIVGSTPGDRHGSRWRSGSAPSAPEGDFRWKLACKTQGGRREKIIVIDIPDRASGCVYFTGIAERVALMHHNWLLTSPTGHVYRGLQLYR